MTMRVSGSLGASSRTSATPSTPGSSMSTRSTSGRMSARARAPPRRSPPRRRPRGRACRAPGAGALRTSGWSSTTITRRRARALSAVIPRPPRAGSPWQRARAGGRSCPAAAPSRSRAPRRSGSPARASPPHRRSAAPSEAGSKPRPLSRISRAQPAVLHAAAHPHDRGVGVASHVRERLADDAQRLDLGPGREGRQLRRTLPLDGEPEPILEVLERARNQLPQRAVRRIRSPQRGDHLARLGDPGVDGGGDLVAQHPGLRAELGLRRQPGRLELRQPQVLGEPVVQLARESLPLLRGGERALALDQLSFDAAQGGDVMEEHEPADRPPLPVRQRRGGHLADATAAGRLDGDLGRALVGPVAPGPGDGCHELRVAREGLRHRLAMNRGHRQAHQAFGRGVDTRQSVLRIEDEQCVGHPLENRLACDREQVEEAEPEEGDRVHQRREVDRQGRARHPRQRVDAEGLEKVGGPEGDLADHDEHDRDPMRGRSHEEQEQHGGRDHGHGEAVQDEDEAERGELAADVLIRRKSRPQQLALRRRSRATGARSPPQPGGR